MPPVVAFANLRSLLLKNAGARGLQQSWPLRHEKALWVVTLPAIEFDELLEAIHCRSLPGSADTLLSDKGMPLIQEPDGPHNQPPSRAPIHPRQ